MDEVHSKRQTTERTKDRGAEEATKPLGAIEVGACQQVEQCSQCQNPNGVIGADQDAFPKVVAVLDVDKRQQEYSGQTGPPDWVQESLGCAAALELALHQHQSQYGTEKVGSRVDVGAQVQ